MKIEQIYTGCLAEAAYYIESNGEALIIDPLRETKPYTDRAAKDGAKIKYILETHFHADFVSGHLDLAKETGATIVYGPTAAPNFEAHIAKDGEVLKLGKLSIVVLHTPGHTMESSTFLLRNEDGKDIAIFTGDTLFIGDVGRPDLAVKTDLTREDLAAHLYDSLRLKIMPLADEIIVYPGHGAGSACGKKMSKQTQDTLGNQKLFNYALRADMSKAEFVKEVTDGLVDPPQYFPKNAVMNKMGYDSITDVMDRGLVARELEEFISLAENHDALILDTRPNTDFPKGFIPNSIFIGIDDNFAMWVGALITNLKQPILFIAEPGREDEVVTRLARVGYDNALGYLKGGFDTWLKAGKEIDVLEEVDATSFYSLYNAGKIDVLDVRKESEFKTEHVKGVQNFPLDFINDNMAAISIDKKYYVHCAGGYRSVIASSILQARGYEVVNVQGGFKDIKTTEIPTTEFHEQNTSL